mgnify:FL=1|jgi:GNAT superfamily N-acetyltransferase|tara:strand:- start:8579 stop:9046 length:468 start_codon:yes stop_codon:yes gene_type:complete
MTVTYQREEFANVRDEIMPLCERHWEEVAYDKETLKLNPSWDMYEKIDAAGLLNVFTLRDGDILAGYLFITVMPHLHYREHLFASSDILYIDQEYRKGHTAAKLLRFAEKEIKHLGVSIMAVSTRVQKPLDKLFVRLGYKNTERVYAKNLRQQNG